ncbi:MAG TPA: hypothetical protein VGI39_16885 [Polyangiaceae bacterium]|jgi:hypothetical protein
MIRAGIVHMSLDVRGALSNWPKRRFRSLIRGEDGRYLSADAAKDLLFDELQKGHQYLPIGDACEGFDFAKGCPGHERPTEPPPSQTESEVRA